MSEVSTATEGERLVAPDTVAFVGTGTMGAPMAARVLAAGFPLRVHDAVSVAADGLVASGATWCDDPASVADGARFVLLSLPGPQQVLDAVLGARGVLAAGTLPEAVVDLSTNSVDAVHRLRDGCAAVGVAFVDAPVSGGVARARDGSLSVMVGAAEPEFAAVGLVLTAIGRDIFHVGPSGSGTIAKIVNNQLFLAAGVLVQEAYLLAGALGMDPADLHRIVSASSAGPYAKLAPLLLGRRFDEVIFRLDIAAKDVELAVATAESVGVDVPLTRAARHVYESSLAAGDGQLVFHATLRELERRAGIDLPVLRRPPKPDVPAGGAPDGAPS
jgi:3-hydroxyisobutyrate dehydrogenase